MPLYGCDCYAYGLLAMGFVDLVVEATMQPYDYLALVPIIEGAGGVITDWEVRFELASTAQTLDVGVMQAVGLPYTLNPAACLHLAAHKGLHAWYIPLATKVSPACPQIVPSLQSPCAFSAHARHCAYAPAPAGIPVEVCPYARASEVHTIMHVRGRLCMQYAVHINERSSLSTG